MGLNIKKSSPEEIKKLQLLEQLKIPVVDIDVWKYVISGEDLQVNKHIYLHNPLVEEVKDFGEQKYLHLISLITMRAYDDCVALDDKGINYQEVSDFEIFIRNTRKLTPENSWIIFGTELDFSKFEIRFDEKKSPYLYYLNETSEEVIIDKTIYAYIVSFVRKINFINAKIEYDMGNEIGRKFLLERKRRKQELSQKSKQLTGTFQTQLGNIISYCCANKGCKYNYQTIGKIKISQLYDQYRRFNFIDERDDFAAALRTGMMKDADIHKGAYKLNPVRDMYN